MQAPNIQHTRESRLQTHGFGAQDTRLLLSFSALTHQLQQWVTVRGSDL